MSKTPDPQTVQMVDLTPAQLHRLLAADYLETMATLIRKGAISGFDFAWDERYEKPVGKLVMSSTSLSGPLEGKLLAQIQEEEEKASKVIEVEDFSEEMKDHQCDNPRCMACNNTNKA